MTYGPLQAPSRQSSGDHAGCMYLVACVLLDSLPFAQLGVVYLQGTGSTLPASALSLGPTSVVSAAVEYTESHSEVNHRCFCLLTRVEKQQWQVPEGKRHQCLADGQQLHGNEMQAAEGHWRMLTRHAAQSGEL